LRLAQNYGVKFVNERLQDCLNGER